MVHKLCNWFFWNLVCYKNIRLWICYSFVYIKNYFA